MSSIYGILNLGNTCYINVNIQMILNCKLVNQLLLEKKDDIKTKELLYSYISILNRLDEIRKQENIELENTDDKIYIRKLKLTSFIDKFRNIFNQVSYNQQDCLEGLTFILTNFHETLSKLNKNNDYNIILDNIRYNENIKDICINHLKVDIVKDYSLFFNVFYSYYLTKINCKNCNNIVNKIEQYKEISLNITKNELNNNLESLLDSYFKNENLNDYRCEKCEMKKCNKKIELLNTPNYLIIQLKRFEFNMKTYNFSKILKEVNYPLFLDMNKYCLQDNINKNINEKNIYELTSIINHLGISLQSGHYTSFHKINNQWFEANDSDINKVNEKYIFNKKNKILSYILIYERKDFN